MAEAGRFPTFLYIGAARSGSTWLYTVMGEHPDIYTPPVKDIQFFDHHYHLGMPWYLQQFSGWKNEQAAGEFSHDYFIRDDYLERIAATLSDVRLILCLREPGERLQSGFNHTRCYYRSKETTVEEYLSNERVEQSFRYAERLKTLYHLFDRRQILLQWYDQLKENPARFIENIYRFVGVDPYFQPPSLHKKVNAESRPRFSVLTPVLNGIVRAARSMGLARLVGRLKNNGLLNRFFFAKGSTDDRIPADFMNAFRLSMIVTYPLLESLIGMPVPERWYELSGVCND